MAQEKDCVCGHSPTGKCVGWHKLSYDQLITEEAKWMKYDPTWIPPRLRPQVQSSDPTPSE